MHHPLVGKRELDFRVLTPDDQRILFGTEARFIFHPTDTSNEPVAGHHDNALVYWPILPTFLRNLFTRAFTDGIRDPRRRVIELEWRRAMLRLRDSIVDCPRCRVENFYDAELTSAQHCWSCKNALPVR
jgi:DNA-binding helix-hairpin-helix protein with protein kinase domain